jgi:catechol 2,3-dioxygenase-like lactoylglutathione lyase family enzyme
MATAIDAALVRFHASPNVSDLGRSIAFYRALLGTEPAKVRDHYAKFDLAEPLLVLSLIPGRPCRRAPEPRRPARAQRRGTGARSG